MNYYIREVQLDQGTQMTAGIKARDDLEEVLQGLGYKPIAIATCMEGQNTSGAAAKLKNHVSVWNEWKKETAFLKKGDNLLIQFPMIEHSIFLSGLLKKLVNRQVTVVLLIHDLELLRAAKRSDVSKAKKMRLKIEEENALKNCSRIVAHNSSMIRYMRDMGIPESKLVNLEIFDYLIPGFDEKQKITEHFGKDKPVIVAGNLRHHKAEYVYHLPDDIPFNLYGVGYDGKNEGNIHYHGAFPSDDLPFVLEGSFGLIWDGEIADTCSGIYGEYLKINNPHKTSLYLASGLPVLIWKHAALAPFIEQNHCGITVESLHDVPSAMAQITEEDYQAMLAATAETGKKLREGFYTKQAMKNSFC